ncbi:uncharacterized protein LOC132758754 [Ruditapes philippinarum]|uniref:uncharacterized protein LOC132758754 n=1 Tax=Ruditapes philippinarum TaxID=129788 RepID=UPI00295A77CE|nr:uncharacterized protein LOC132758754 [Ruditapes philippinarum]
MSFRITWTVFPLKINSETSSNIQNIRLVCSSIDVKCVVIISSARNTEWLDRMAEQFAIEMFKYIKSLEDFLSRKTENGEVITQDEYSKMCTYKNTIEYISNIHNFMKDHAQQQVTEDQMASLNNKQKDLIRTDELEKINDLGLKSLQQVPDVQQNLRQQSNKTKAKKTYNQVKNEVQKSYSKDRNLAGEVTLELENTDSCFKTLKTLDRHTQSAGRTKLLYNIIKKEKF